MVKIGDLTLKYTQSSFLDLLKAIESNMDLPPLTEPKMISSLISMTEALIWSEQNHAGLFEYNQYRTFIDSRIIETLTFILCSNSNKQVTVQLLRCSTLLIHNLTEESCKNFLISSQFFTELISMPFDFSDDEIVENYTSMLKGLAFNLNKMQLLHLVTSKNFSLFTSAMMFFNYKENLVKTAARAVVLNILKLRSEYVNRFVLESGFMYNLVNSVRDSVGIIGKKVKGSIGQLEELVYDLMDTLYYMNDIFLEHNDEFDLGIIVNIKRILIFPVLYGSFTTTQLLPHHVPIPISLYVISQVILQVKYPDLQNFLINTLFSSELPSNYLECMQQSVCSEELLSPTKELEPNPILNNIQQFLKCRDDNLVALGLNIILVSLSSCENNGMLKDLGLLPGLQTEKYINWVGLIGEILTSDQEQRFFTCLLATRCLNKMLQRDNRLSYSLLTQILKNATIKLSESLIISSASPKAPKDYSKLMKTQWEYIKTIKWEEKFSIPLNFISPSIDEANVPLENRRHLTETEKFINEMRFFWHYRNFFGFLQGMEIENEYPINFNPICDVNVDKIYKISDRCFVDKPKILVKSKDKKGLATKVLVRDENFFILLRKCEDSEDSYRIDALKNLGQVTLAENSQPKILILFLQDIGKIEIIFEDTMEWLSLKNFYEKGVRNIKITETIEIQNFLREQKRVLDKFD